MNLLILGATGRVGGKLLQKALDDGHQVVVLARSPEKLRPSNQNLYIVQGNVLSNEDLEKALTTINIDIVISALGTDKNNTLSRSMPPLISLMTKHEVKRIITIGTAGILNSRTDAELYRFQSGESKRKSTTAAEDHLAAYQYLQASKLDWTIVCPTYLPAGEEKGNYRVEKNWLPKNGKQITVADTAAFVYSQISSFAFINTRVGIAY